MQLVHIKLLASVPFQILTVDAVVVFGTVKGSALVLFSSAVLLIDGKPDTKPSDA